MDLFDWAARTNDPVDSQIAAKVIKPNLPKLRRMFVDSCRALGGGNGAGNSVQRYDRYNA